MLSNVDRETNDAYWTPYACAYECLAEVEEVARISDPEWTPTRILEPCVGGGAWLRAIRRAWPEASVDRCDLDPDAPGLHHDVRPDEEQLVGDFLQLASPTDSPEHVYSLVVGNPPYKGDTVAWFQRALRLAPVAAFVLRSTILGSQERFEWWLKNLPGRVTVLSPRPLWEGPGRRTTTDKVDSILVTWAPGVTRPSFGWRAWR